MNWRALKDSKTIISFSLALILEIIGVVLARKNDDYWVIFIVIGLFLTFYGVHRANKIYMKN